MNEYTITNAFEFADEIRSIPMNEEDILVSYDVTAISTNVPLSETINILVDKAFTNDWFNQTYDLNLEKGELAQLLEVAITNQLFQFDGQLYRRMPNTDAAADFLTTLNGLHPSLKFTMELPADNMIPFIGIEIIKNGTELETRVYRKPTNTGLLLHFQSHVDKRYKAGLLKTMLHRGNYVISVVRLVSPYSQFL